jgi:hypothetical protein
MANYTITQDTEIARPTSYVWLIGNDLIGYQAGTKQPLSGAVYPMKMRLTNEVEPYLLTAPIVNMLQGFVVPSDMTLPLIGGEDAIIGNPAPSQKVVQSCILKFLWPVAVGTRTITIDCRQARDPGSGVRPILRVKANPDCQVYKDLTANMDGTVNGWVTLGPISVSVGMAGVLEVWREVWDPRGDVQVWWDNVKAT